MSPINALRNLGLLCWSTIFLGLRKGWISREDVINFAVALLVNGSDDEDVAIIASGESLDDDEFSNLISNHFKQSDNAADSDKWLLAHLLSISELDDDEQTKLDRLQEVYADFDYPEEMASCSIYSQDKVDPLLAMMQVIDELKSRCTKR